MGIKNFQQYIKDVYDDACKTNWPKVSYDNLYIDLNHVLHHVCYLSSDVADLQKRFMDYVRNTILQIKPKKCVYLVADGPAPLAKMLLQRKRRLDAIKTIEGDIDLNKHLNLNLTPGTEFMNDLEIMMQPFYTYIKQKFKVDVKTFILDAGEGEIKIKHLIDESQKINSSDTHIIFSSDSDMVLLLFTCKYVSNIYQMIDKNVIIHFGTMLDMHREKFGRTESDQLDFVFINLLMGNDYLPKASYFKMENIWEAYKFVARTNPEGLIKMHNDTIEVDNIFLLTLIVLGTKKTPQHFMNKFTLYDIKSPYYKNYTNGLYWCFSMYVLGKCTDYLYQYDHEDSPHIMGVALSLMANHSYNIKYSDPIDVGLCGILLIPERANTLLSKEQIMIANQLVKKHNIIYEEGRCDKCKVFSSSAGKLNAQIKQCEPETDERKSLSKQVALLNKQFTAHRTIHEKLTSTKIIDIVKDFNIIRDEISKTNVIDNTLSNDKQKKSYVPPETRRKLNTKSMFRKVTVTPTQTK
jgi:5'-3' exonuclease